MRIANIVSPGAEYLQPDPHELGPGVSSQPVVTCVDVPFATDPLRLALKDLVYVEAAVRAERAGFDAVFVNTVADYGVPLMREAVAIPVTGAGEASLRAAAGFGPFAIVTVWPSTTRLSYDRVLHQSGTAESCLEVRYVLEEPEIGTMGGGRAIMAAVDEPGTPIAERVLHSCRQAAAGGARAIVLGCTCMSRLTGWLQDGSDVTVVDPLIYGHRATEDAVRAASGRPTLVPNTDTVARVLAVVAAMTPLGASVPANWVASADAAECVDVCAAIG